jgi:hypothetical protein
MESPRIKQKGVAEHGEVLRSPVLGEHGVDHCVRKEISRPAVKTPPIVDNPASGAEPSYRRAAPRRRLGQTPQGPAPS